MIISPGRKFIFVHVPKTGGTALAQALEDRAHRDDILIGDTPKAQKRKGRLKTLTPKGRLWKHSTIADVEGIVDPEGYFVLTLTRNPWDRVVSYYHWLLAQSFDHAAVRLAQSSDFSAFINARDTQVSLRAHPVAWYATDSIGVDRTTLSARIERWNEDLAPFWDHLGFRVSLERINASKRDRDYRGYYSDADAALIADVCAADIVAGRYTF